jgi:hypothetical protein
MYHYAENILKKAKLKNDMKYLNDYRTFLVESKTISDDSEKYQEEISKTIIPKIKILIKNNINIQSFFGNF